MPTIKRLRTPLIVMSGAMLAMVALAGPASAAVGVYPPPSGTQVLGTSVTVASAASAPAVATASSPALAFTGTNAIGIGALGGLLLVGGGAMVFVGKRRKVDA